MSCRGMSVRGLPYQLTTPHHHGEMIAEQKLSLSTYKETAPQLVGQLRLDTTNINTDTNTNTDTDH